jgi:hypothetical protein
MPFGKHKGQTLDKIPRGYLRWVLEACDLSAWDGLEAAMRLAVEKHHTPEVVSERWPRYVGPEEVVHTIVAEDERESSRVLSLGWCAP